MMTAKIPNDKFQINSNDQIPNFFEPLILLRWIN